MHVHARAHCSLLPPGPADGTLHGAHAHGGEELLKDSFAYSKDLSQACIMAQPLMPKKPQQVKED